MSIIWYFIAGIIFVIIVYPLLEELTNLILSIMELLKGKISLQLTKINLEIQNLSKETKTKKIGFSAEEED